MSKDPIFSLVQPRINPSLFNLYGMVQTLYHAFYLDRWPISHASDMV